jgi:hypothetical protein
VATVVEGDFEWESAKATSNIAKHGVSFFEAATVFADPMAIYLDDGSGTGVLVVIGMSLRERVLYVVHCNVVNAIESSAPDRPRRASEQSTRPEAIHEPGN